MKIGQNILILQKLYKLPLLNMNRTLHSLTEHWKIGLSILFCIGVFLFWHLAYPAHLAFQEQLQLFLFDSNYLIERIVVPGGVANYLSDFLIQFYYHTWAGAIILAVLFLWMQRLTWSVAKHQGTSELYYPLSFIPAIVVWYFMTDENAMLSYLIALIWMLQGMRRYQQMQGQKQRMLYALFSLPVLYWIAGPVHFILAFWMMVHELQITFRNCYLFQGIAIAVSICLLAIVCPLLSTIVAQYSIPRLMVGTEYYRYPQAIPPAWVASLIVMAITPLLLPCLPDAKKRKSGIILLGIALTALGGGWLIKSGCNFEKEEAILYDRLAHRERWQEIIERAEKKAPTTPQGVTCLNLALGMTGQLTDRLFEFYQNGSKGLIQHFSHDIVFSLCSSEVHYQLGMVSATQQMMFEVMSSIPIHQLNARCLKRLAETNLINGHYEVAAKYLRTLQKSLYYKRWADHVLKFLYNEANINNHPTWGRLRKTSFKEDFLYTGNQMVNLLGVLFQDNNSNRLAYDYLMTHLLLDCDLQHVVEYLPLIQYTNYKQLPRAFQEALVYDWAQKHTNFDGMPWKVSENAKQGMREFIKLYNSPAQAGKQEMLKARFGKTFWYYHTTNYKN